MVEHQHISDAEFEAALSRMRPRSAQMKRDRVMYEAGRASLEGGGRRSQLLSSIAAAGWLLAAGFCGLWLQRPEAVIVTNVEYRERIVEPTEVTPTEARLPVAAATDTATETQRSPASRVRAHGRGNDLDALIAASLSRTRRIPERGSRSGDRGVVRADPDSSRPGDSYIVLMKTYLDSARTGADAGGRL